MAETPSVVTRATGRRKEASAGVRLVPGTGRMIVNGRDAEEYFHRAIHLVTIRQPLALVQREGLLDVLATVKGGGETGQAEAIRHGIARALCALEPDLRPVIKREGFLTRDPRAKERKKYGRPGARKRFQYSKR